jgi:hypothetical protein
MLDPVALPWSAVGQADRQYSGLWNVQHTGERYDPGFLDLMAARVQALR